MLGLWLLTRTLLMQLPAATKEGSSLVSIQHFASLLTACGLRRVATRPARKHPRATRRCHSLRLYAFSQTRLRKRGGCAAVNPVEHLIEHPPYGGSKIPGKSRPSLD